MMMSKPIEPRIAAIDSVLQWYYSNTACGRRAHTRRLMANPKPAALPAPRGEVELSSVTVNSVTLTIPEPVFILPPDAAAEVVFTAASDEERRTSLASTTSTKTESATKKMVAENVSMGDVIAETKSEVVVDVTRQEMANEILENSIQKKKEPDTNKTAGQRLSVEEINAIFQAAMLNRKLAKTSKQQVNKKKNEKIKALAELNKPSVDTCSP